MGTGRENPLTLFAVSDFRGRRRPFGIRQDDRMAHLFVVGKTGTGKSTLLETFMRADAASGRGFALLDPHGDLYERVKGAIPESRRADTVFFDPADREMPPSWNPLLGIPPERKPLAVANLVETFRKLWSDSWGPRTEHLLRHSLFVLLDAPEPSLAGIPRLFRDAEFRKRAALRSGNAAVREFWLKEFAGYPARFRAEVVAPLENKVGAFLADPVLSRILTVSRNGFDLRVLMDRGGILLANLAKGRIGEGPSSLLGSLLLASMGLSGLGRADSAEEDRPDFHVFADECHAFATRSLASMLSELRKYRVSLTLAVQYLGQLEPPIREAILGNVGTLVSFRVGAEDAERIARELGGEFEPRDLVSLSNHSVAVRIMVAGVIAPAFSAQTWPSKKTLL